MSALTNHTFKFRFVPEQTTWENSAVFLYGLCKHITDFNPNNAGRVPEIGTLLSGEVPSWFKGFTAYEYDVSVHGFAATGFVVWTDNDEGAATQGDNYFTVYIDELAGVQCGTGGNAAYETADTANDGRYYAIASTITYLKNKMDNNEAVDVKIVVEKHGSIADSFSIQGNGIRNMTQPFGILSGKNMVNEIVF